ncbi:hypothetical protein U9M48_027134 [Paspalum notatum var. saurae]|uniref:Uncharacterized protein n=1 Tax=Paspalum notatum var. saurae TaxID=547442 RepID=A0AAQ3TVX3_PASNO
MTLPALPEFTPSVQLAGASTPRTFPLSPLLRTDLRPVLSPLPATTLTFESPAQGPSVTAAAFSSGPSRRDLLEQTVELVTEQITQPVSSQAVAAQPDIVLEASETAVVLDSPLGVVDRAAAEMDDSDTASDDDTRFQFISRRPPPPLASSPPPPPSD